MSFSDFFFTSNGCPAPVIRCHIVESRCTTDTKNLLLWGPCTSDLWTGKGTKKEILKKKWYVLIFIRCDFKFPALTFSPTIPPPLHHKHTHILKQEVLDHMTSHSQTPLLLSPITSPPPPPIQSRQWKKQGFLDTSWRLPGTIRNDKRLSLFIYLFIYKKI